MAHEYPQAEKQTYGLHCEACGEIWDGHQVPCPIDVALRSMNANQACWKCGSTDIYSVMPYRYEEMKKERNALATK
jgi:hypothetical protein